MLVSRDSKHHKNAEDDITNIWKVIFIHFSYLISTFGIKTYKRLCFMKHFFRSLQSSRERALQITVNVWDHMSRVTSRCLEQLGWSASALTSWKSKASISFRESSALVSQFASVFGLSAFSKKNNVFPFGVVPFLLGDSKLYPSSSNSIIETFRFEDEYDYEQEIFSIEILSIAFTANVRFKMSNEEIKTA